MKELSIEEKAKRYDDAIEKAKEMIKAMTNIGGVAKVDDIQYLFPELKESEDEKIRKGIIRCVKGNMPDNDSRKKYLAWLEKQGKQKSIWHNEDEEPQKDSLILLIMQSGNPIVAKVIEPNHTFNHGERWAYIDDLLKKQGEQNPAWSEEDENNLRVIVDYLIADNGLTLKYIDWLKSVKNKLKD